MESRFLKLYKKQLYVHHYQKFMDKAHFDESIGAVGDIIKKYS
jgi:tubulin epsilon